MLAFAAAAYALPPELLPAAPFPLVLDQSLEREFVAPGVERATYRLQTSAGPLVVSLVHVDPHAPDVRIGAVLAHDRIVSSGETVSSMAQRTGAVAGINADYFDIGNTNAPVGVLAENGTLLRTPSERPALAVERDGSVAIATYALAAQASVNERTTIPITTVDEWPPHDGAAFITPAFGPLRPAPRTTVLVLTPLVNAAGNEATAATSRFRVTRVDDGALPIDTGYALGIGPAAAAPLAVLPDVGDLIDISAATEPPVAGTAAVVGGGPALVRDGVPVDDPASPGYATRDRRIPAAAAGIAPDGSLLLIVADGRRPATSIGVNRAELIALLQSLGAANALQFDSGGSATLVARVLGESEATVRNDPSDGVERPVADGLFVYSDAPVGPPAALVVRPSRIEALPGVEISLRAARIDAAGHALGAAVGPWRSDGAPATVDANGILRTATRPQSGSIRIERDGLAATVPITIVPEVARVTIVPDRADPDPGATIDFHALAFDPHGVPVRIGNHLTWSAQRGTIAPDGHFTAGSVDGYVRASVGAVSASDVVHVGRHLAPLTGFDDAALDRWHFSTVPAAGPGGLVFTPQGTLQLSYDFRSGERAAYAATAIPLDDDIALSCAIDGDGSGAGLRVAIVDRYGERSALTFAQHIDWTGAQRRTLTMPASLAPPLVLQSFYVVGSLGTAPVTAAGTIGIRDCQRTIPGTAPPAP